ncbi:MAG: F0F1 ATP synthase subunit A [bacterium]|nr:F0F1 ATP synthase subunit A [bacterium]
MKGKKLKKFIIFATVTLVLFAISFVGGTLGTALLNRGSTMGFLNIPKPSPELPAQVIFYIGYFPVTNTILTSWITMLVLLCLSLCATRKMKLIPKGAQNVFEGVIEALLDFMEGVAGKKNARRFFPVVATIFLFVITNSWLSLLPGFGSILIGTHEGEAHLLRGANTDINLPLALAIIAFVSIEFWGITEVGFSKYISKFMNFKRFFRGIGQLLTGKFKTAFGDIFSGIIDIFVSLLETISEFVRLLSFTFRLFGNMTAGEILLLVVTFLVPWIMPVPFYGLECLVGFIQAFIFSGLTLVFATIATTGHEEEH